MLEVLPKSAFHDAIVRKSLVSFYLPAHLHKGTTLGGQDVVLKKTQLEELGE